MSWNTVITFDWSTKHTSQVVINRKNMPIQFKEHTKNHSSKSTNNHPSLPQDKQTNQLTN